MKYRLRTVYLVLVVALSAGCSGNSNEVAPVSPAQPGLPAGETPQIPMSDAAKPYLGDWQSDSKLENCDTVLRLTEPNQFEFRSNDRILSGNFAANTITAGLDFRAKFSVISDNQVPACNAPLTEHIANFNAEEIAIIFNEDAIDVMRMVDPLTNEDLAFLTRQDPGSLILDHNPGDADGLLTSYEQIKLLEVQEGQSLTTALMRFAATFGPIEGAGDIVADGSMPLTASDAVNGLYAYRDQLTPQQRQQIVKLAFGSQYVNINSSTTPDASNLARDADYDQLQIDLRFYRKKIQDGTAWQLTGTDIYVGFADTDTISDENTAVGSDGAWAVSSPVVLSLFGFETLGEIPGFPDAFDVDDCVITVGAGYKRLSQKARISILSHEVFHCFQYAMLNFTSSAISATPKWILEGTASWVGEQVANGSPINVSWWASYNGNSDFRLSTADPYSAIGFWTHVGNRSDLWGLLSAITQLTGDSLDRFGSIISLTGSDLLDTWASSAMQKPDWGPDWTLTSPGPGGLGDGNGKRPQNVSLNAELVDNFYEIIAAPGQTRHVEITPQGTRGEPWILEISSQGIGKMHWVDGGNELVVGGIQQWCINGSCVCQDGSMPEGLDPLEVPADSTRLNVSVSGGDTLNTQVAAKLLSMDDLCETDDESNSDIPPEPVVDTCLIGEWRVDTEHYLSELRRLNLDPNLTVTDVSGSVKFTIQQDNIADISYAALTIGYSDANGTVTKVSINGGGTFSWSVQGDKFFSDGEDASFTVTSTVFIGELAIEIDLGDNIFTASDLAGNPNGTRFSCDDNTFQLLPANGGVSIRYEKVR